MNTHSSSWQSCGSGGNLPRPHRANTILNDIAPPSDKLRSPQAILDYSTLPSHDPYGSPPPVALNGSNTVRKLRSSSQGKKKKGILGFMSGLPFCQNNPFSTDEQRPAHPSAPHIDSSTPSKRAISTPHDPVHLTHVRSDSSTRELIGLPAERERILQKNNRQYQEINRQAVAENLPSYQGTVGTPGKLAHKDIAPASTVPQQINGAYGLEGGSQNTSTKMTLSDVPRSIIHHALDFIRNSPQQEYHYAEDCKESAQQRALQEMDDEIDLMENTIETLLTSLRKSLTARVIRRKKERNILVRFHQLPFEIASEILWLSIADPWNYRPSYSFAQRRRTILSVCLFWRTVVESSPRSWSIVELTATPEVITTFLENSKCHPLEIKCLSNREYNYAPPMNPRGRLELIAPHTQRIRSLILDAPSTEGILTVLDKPAPMLEELRLSFNFCWLVQPIDLFCGQASRLRDVALVNIPVRWDSRVLEGLKSLKIKAKPGYSPTDTQLLWLLEVNPELEKMDIEDVRVPDDFGDGVWPTHPGSKRGRVIMGNMREMRLLNLPFELVRVILANVEIPSITHLDINCLFRGHPASQLLGPNIQHLVPPIIQRLTSAELAQLTIGEESVGLAIYLPLQIVPAIRIQLNNTAPVSGCGWLVENFFTAERRPGVGEPDTFQVDLKFGGSFDMQGGAFVPFFDRLDAVEVKSLAIDIGCKHVEELIDYLGEMKEDSQWPLPHLTSLTVQGEARTATHILAALQGRKRDVDLTGIAALEELDIDGLGVIDLTVEKDLQELIGPSGKFIRATSFGSPRYPRTVASYESLALYHSPTIYPPTVSPLGSPPSIYVPSIYSSN